MSLPQELQIFMKWRIKKSDAFFHPSNHNTTIKKTVKHISFWIKAVLCAFWPLCCICLANHSVSFILYWEDLRVWNAKTFWGAMVVLNSLCHLITIKYFYCLQRLKIFRRERGIKSYVCVCPRLWLQSQTMDFHEQEVCSRISHWRRTTPIQKLQKVVIIQNNFSGKDRREIHCNIIHVV